MHIWHGASHRLDAAIKSPSLGEKAALDTDQGAAEWIESSKQSDHRNLCIESALSYVILTFMNKLCTFVEVMTYTENGSSTCSQIIELSVEKHHTFLSSGLRKL